jgi:two-component system, NarL family, nitrate/nitrite response regulator NarL
METPGEPKIRILLIDDQALFREGAARFFGAQPEFEVVGQTGLVDEALAILASRPVVDVALLDIDLGDRRGTEFLVRARDAGYSGPVLVLTGGISDREKRILLAHGAAGVILKTSSLDLLMDAVRLAAGRTNTSAPLPAQPVRRRDRKALTERERDVLRAVFDGHSNKEIAASLDISETSVKAALQQLFDKTGVRTRGQLVRAALEQYSDEL